MTKKRVDLVYLIFLFFGFFLLSSFFYILQINENTKNNYILIEEIESLSSINQKFDNTLIKNLQYIEKEDISYDLNKFKDKLKYINKILSTITVNENQILYLEQLENNFYKKAKLIQEFQEVNSFLVISIQKLLKLQANIQKRYYFSPISIEVNSLIVNIIQASLGKEIFIRNIEKNIEVFNELESLYKLVDNDLDEFSENSSNTLEYINDLIVIRKTKDSLELNASIVDFKNSMVEYFRRLALKEKRLSYFLLFVILIFILVLFITYNVDKRHKSDLLRFKKAIENSDDSIVITDANRKIIYVNESFEKSSGYSKDEVLGKNPNILKSNLQNEEDFKDLNNKLYSGQKWDGEFINRRKNGEIYYEKASIIPLFLNEELDGFLAIKLDITDYVNQKLDLFEQTKKLNIAQKIAHLGSWEIEYKTKEIYFSKEMYNICNLDENITIDKKTFMKMLTKDDRKSFIRLCKKRVVDEGYNELVHTLNLNNGAKKYVQNRWSSEYDKDFKVIRSSGVILDITHTKMLELENEQKQHIMFQQSKMAAMGEMLENIAHQWRQPLSVISTLASGMKIKKDFGILTQEEEREYLDTIVSSTQHMSQTIDDFRDFFKSNKNMIEVDLESCIFKTIKLLGSKFKNRDIEIIQNTKSLTIKGYEGEIIQALINILSNAQDALLSNDIEKKMIFINLDDEDNIAKISIKDNAKGIDEEKIEHIFEPYFTTKKDNGTGIGLFMTYEIIVKHHKGSVKAKNCEYIYDDKKYIGAEFVIEFPLS